MVTETLNALHLKVVVNEIERQEAIDLLKQQHLPVSDIDEDKVLYLLKADERTIGTGGLDIFEDCALLRSVSVLKQEQGKGFGKYINEEIEKYLKDKNLSFKVVNDEYGLLSSEFNVKAFPTTFIYDKNKNLKFTEVGYTSTFGLKLRLWLSSF